MKFVYQLIAPVYGWYSVDASTYTIGFFSSLESAVSRARSHYEGGVDLLTYSISYMGMQDGITFIFDHNDWCPEDEDEECDFSDCVYKIFKYEVQD
jgi:hypothetical protein